MNNRDCNGCQGIQVLTPRAIHNRSQLSEIDYRVGTQAAFLETMLARISELEIPKTNLAGIKSFFRPLKSLTARDADDPSIALLDSWALIADVLAFYQERYANESYLRTASERRSIQQLANLVGYKLRPGLSSSVYLAFEVDDTADEVPIPKGTPTKSTPTPDSGATSQTFETSEDFWARPSWNEIRPRLSKPTDFTNLVELETIFLKGTGLRIQANDLLAIRMDPSEANLRTVESVEEITEPNRQLTRIRLSPHSESTRALLNRFKDIIHSELTKLDGTVIDSHYRFDIEADLKKTVDAINVSDGLANADKVLQDEVIVEALLTKYKQEFDSVANWFSSTKAIFEVAKEPEYLSALDAFTTSYANHLIRVQGWIGKLPGNGDFVAGREDSFWKLADEQFRPDIQIAYVPRSSVAAEQTTKVVSFPAKVNKSITMNRIEIVGAGTNGVTFAKAVVDVPNGGDPTALLASKLKDLEVKQIPVGINQVLFTCSAFNDGEANPRDFLGQWIHTIFKPDAGGAVPSQALTVTVPYKRLLMREASAEFVVDKDFQLNLPDPNKVFEVTVAISDADTGHLFHPSSGQTREVRFKGKGPELVNDIRSTKIQQIGTDRVVRVVMTFFNEGNNKPIAIALREVVVVNSGSINFVLEELAKESGNEDQQSSQAIIEKLKQRLNNGNTQFSAVITAQTFLGAVNAAGEIKDEQLRREFQLDDRDAEAAKAFVDSFRNLRDSAEKLEIKQFLSEGATKEFIRSELVADLTGTQLVEIASNYEARLKNLVSKIIAPKNPSDALFPLTSKLLRTLLQVRVTYLVETFFEKSVRDEFRIKKSNSVDPISGLIDFFRNFVAWQQRLSKDLRPFAKILGENDENVAVVFLTKSLVLTQILHELEAKQDLNRMDLFPYPAESSLSHFLSSAEEKIILLNASQDLDKLISVLKKIRSKEEIAGSPHTIATAQSLLLLIVRSFLSNVNTIDVATLLGPASAIIPQLQSVLSADDRQIVFDQFRRFRVTKDVTEPRVFVFRIQANVFGWNSQGVLACRCLPGNPPTPIQTFAGPIVKEELDVICLNGEFKKTTVDTPIAIRKSKTTGDTLAFNAESVEHGPLTRYGISAMATSIRLSRPWLDTSENNVLLSDVIRQSRVWCDAELLEIAEEPLDLLEESKTLISDIDEIVLDDFYPELSVAANVIFEGVQANKDPSLSIPSSITLPELYKLVAVTHGPPELDLYGDRFHTKIRIDRKLGRDYLRGNAKIFANVVEATHGGAVNEVLGSGNGRKPFQRFPLKDAPLSRVPAANLYGLQDELLVRVNDVRWDGVDRISDAAAEVTNYELISLLDESHAVRFGDGTNGARLPTGNENIRGKYRVGLGVDGNVESDRIDQVPSPPFGVKAVRNPLRASGGADKDTVFQSRERTGLAAASMQKLVSLVDYRNFALFFAGIDKAKATLQNGMIDLTVAGASFEPLLEDSALFRNLKQTLKDEGEPGIAVILHPHQVMLMFIFANVRIDDRFAWEDVERHIREALYDRFGYKKAQFDQHVYASDVIATMQSVMGVTYVDLDAFAGLSQNAVDQRIDLVRNAETAFDIKVTGGQLCFLTREIPNTLQIEQIR